MESHQEPQIENPVKALEPTGDPSPLPPTPQPPSTDADDTTGGAVEDPNDAKTASSEISDMEKKQRRAERFGMPVQLSEQEKRSSRAERFGTSAAEGGKNGSDKLEDDKRKARAERFGLTAQMPVDDDEAKKKKARLERFAEKPKPVSAEEEGKRKARALRFSGASNATSESDGKPNPELKETVPGTKGEA